MFCRFFFLNVLNKHLPLKKKSVRPNHDPYISNAYRKHNEGIKILDSISYKKTKQALKAYKYCNRLSE